MLAKIGLDGHDVGIDVIGINEIQRMLDKGIYRYFGPRSETDEVIAAFAVSDERTA